MTIRPFTIFGIYPDNLQRHADVIRAAGPVNAEKKYRRKMGAPMYVAAVVEGDHQAADTFSNAAAMDDRID